VKEIGSCAPQIIWQTEDSRLVSSTHSSASQSPEAQTCGIEREQARAYLLTRRQLQEKGVAPNQVQTLYGLTFFPDLRCKPTRVEPRNPRNPIIDFVCRDHLVLGVSEQTRRRMI
jgi:hypothetical protein